MSTDAPPPVTSEQVTATPPAPADQVSGERIELPPIEPKPPTPASPKFLRRLAVLDGMLVVLLLAFAFVTSCTRALNSDVFLHLAAGRAVAQGELVPTTDLSTFTATRTWVNHSWLPDFVAYQVHQLPWGDGILVLIKATLIALLGWVLLRAGTQPGRSLFLPAVCTLLALLTVSPRLLLQSTVLSFLLLGVTLWLLIRVREGKFTPWLLPLVCLVWVNLDGWFLLGPALLLLFMLGEVLQGFASEESDETPRDVTRRGAMSEVMSPTPLTRLRSLSLPHAAGVVGVWVLLLSVCVLACLVNPYHIHAFTLPVPLDHTGAGGVVSRDFTFRSMYLAPWEELYFNTRIGWSAAGLSYFVLLAAGLGSFALTAPRWRWWRLIVWIGFAALSLFNARSIPFFAIVAGPITALNFLDGLANYLGAEIKGDINSRQVAIVGRIFAAFAALVMIVLSIPGWLQAEPHIQRQFGFGIHTDEGLRGAAEQMKQWRDAGALPQTVHYFNLTPDVANYFAWFCPGERGFFDHRVTVFSADTARDYLAVREAFRGEQLPGEDEKQQRKPPAWRKLFADRKIQFVVYHGYNVSRDSPTLQRLYSNPNEFTPCYIGGSTAILAWSDPERPPTAPLDPRLPIDFDQLAFGKDVQKAPDERPTLPGSQPWYSVLLPQPLPATRERDTAWQHRERFDALQPLYSFHILLDMKGAALASFVGLGAGGPRAQIPAMFPALFPLRQPTEKQDPRGARHWAEDTIQERMIAQGTSLGVDRDQGPVASLYLAIRSARRAIHETPDDALAYVALADSYSRLATRTRERPRSGMSQRLALVRQTQVTAALRNALACNPPTDLAFLIHLRMAETLRSQSYLDLHVKHSNEAMTLRRKMPPPPGITDKQYVEGLAAQDKIINKMETELKNNKSRHLVEASSRTVPLRKAENAIKLGLSELALETLDKSASDIGPAGAQIALKLLLGTGRLDGNDGARQILEMDSDDPQKQTRKKRGFGLLLTEADNTGNRQSEPGFPAYEWYAFQLAAGSGDYAEADRMLAEAMEVVRRDPTVWEGLMQAKELERGTLDTVKKGLRNQHMGDLLTLRALMSLEAGHLDRAKAQAAEAQEWALEVPPGLGLKQVAELVAELAAGNSKHQRR